MGRPRAKRCVRALTTAALLALSAFFTLAVPDGALAQTALKSAGELNAHLKANQRLLERKLRDYNKKRRIVPDPERHWTVRILDWRVDRIEAERAFVVVEFEVGPDWRPNPATLLFELAWADGGLRFAGHREALERAADIAPVPAGASDRPPVKSADEVEAYMRENLGSFEERLAAYNKKHRIQTSASLLWDIGKVSWKIDRLEGDRAFLEINYTVAPRSFWPAAGGAIFELKWVREDLKVVAHRAIPPSGRRGGGWVGDSNRDCVYNYYAPKPCPDTLQRWSEFAEHHGLPLNPESAAIFQSYKHHDVATGDRLMARARGQPDPGGESVFGLQAEIRAMNLSQYRGNLESPCGFNPYGERPCPEILGIFRRFAARHGLPADPNTATMFEAYARSDFQKADVIYALSIGLEVPAYGYLPTGIAREVAGLRIRLDQLSQGGKNPCGANPYMPDHDRYRPCPEALPIWRDFAARYGLDDNSQNARIFAAYAAGEYRVGDQLFANAKGVSLEQLLEAAGMPTRGLVIEVYPGRRQLQFFNRGIPDT